MKVLDDRFRDVHGYREGRADAVDPDTSGKALAYKKDFLKRILPIDRRQIATRLAGDRFYVTRKYDGEYAMIVHDGGRTVTINRSGRVRTGIPCIEEAGRLLAAAGIAEAMFGAELYIEPEGRRGRVNDLLAALADKRRIGALRLAVFDLVELDGRPWRADYADTWRRLHELFGSGELVREVDLQVVRTPEEVARVYDKWVVGEHSEGLVVRSDLPFVYKIKPRHSVDVVVVGFSEGAGTEKGQVRSLLVALMPAEGRYQVIGRVGSGLVEEVRELLFDRFSRHVVASEFIETDANMVAFRMVRPDTVVEITVGDLLYETEAGPKMNTLLEIDRGTYRIVGTVEGVKFIAPVFVRIRTDKRADAGDVRLGQLEHFAAPSAPEQVVTPSAPVELPRSRVLFRDVYRKTVGAKIMVRKFMVWKTNKEQSGDYPAYVLYVADFSTGRMEPLRRDVDVSDSVEQIRRMLARKIEQNVRSGWTKVSSLGGPPHDEPASKGPAAKEPAAKGPAAKGPTAKDSAAKKPRRSRKKAEA